MKLEGQTDLPRPPEEVFDRLLDPAVLQRCIPGCEALEAVDESTYDAKVRAGVGPVKGTFEGHVTVHDVQRPERYDMTIEGKSSIGHVRGSASLRLEPLQGGGTRAHYLSEARVSGLIASVGGRLIDVAARKVAGQFFERMAAELAR